MKIKKGITRIVFLIGGYAIKFPNFSKQHNHGLHGMYANWSERHYTKIFKGYPEYYNKISPTIFCMRFGLFSIQKRVILLDRSLTIQECEYFKEQTTDIKHTNFGYLNDMLVCIDYV